MRRAERAMALAFFLLIGVPGAAHAASFGDLVINEINWAGDEASTTHEWIEIFNPTERGIALSGWSLYETNTATSADSAVQSVVFPSMLLEAGDYLVVMGNRGDAGIVLPSGTLSYAISSFSSGMRNAGEQLILKDDTGNTIDLANRPGTLWFAGSGTPVRRSMARNAFPGTTVPDGTLADSWHTSDVATGTGTPGLPNYPSASVPVPAPLWLLGSGLIGLVGIRRRVGNT